jgi:hypothetical protein
MIAEKNNNLETILEGPKSLTFVNLKGEALQMGPKGKPTVDAEKAWSQSLVKQLRAADPKNPQQLSIIKQNLNTLSNHLNLGLQPLSTDSTLDNATVAAIQYFNNNAQLFMEHGISDHMKAKELEAITASAFTEAEAASIPTIEDLKNLEVDLDRLNEDKII